MCIRGQHVVHMRRVQLAPPRDAGPTAVAMATAWCEVKEALARRHVVAVSWMPGDAPESASHHLRTFAEVDPTQAAELRAELVSQVEASMNVMQIPGIEGETLLESIREHLKDTHQVVFHATVP